ncbi:MAG TPA: hypothetical protein VFS67_04560 [Polyangiaceae bacterium]|nr:hypothetical protein [Polyangiaceae bacterium]
MIPHPVALRVSGAPPRERVHLALRLLLLVALGTIGCSTVYWLAYLMLPALAALLIAYHLSLVDRYPAFELPSLSHSSASSAA